MYTARILSLGQTAQKGAVLEDAITYILKAARYQTFPTGTWWVSPTSFEQRVTEIMQRANGTRPAGVAAFGADEVRAALIERGYNSKAPPVVVSPAPRAPAVQENGVSIPIAPVFPTVAPVKTKTYLPAVKAEAIPPVLRQPGRVILPVVVPRSPTFPEIPTAAPPKKKSNIILWIAGLLALYVLGKADAPPHRQPVRSRRKKPVSGNSTLSGATANCGLWQEVESQKTGALLWRCLKFAPACRPGFACESPERLQVAQKKQIRVCVESKKVKPTSTRFKSASITRCAKFLRVCTDRACLTEPFRKPSPSPGHSVNIKSMIYDVSKHMAEERNEAEETAGKALGREIVDRGGIRSYRKGVEKEEYRAIPIFMRKKTGLPMDQMASEMGYDSEQDLIAEIKRQYSGTTKKKRRYTASDFTAEAEEMVWRDLDSGMISGLGQDLFPGLRRELALDAEDLATSDDPLEMHLERKGWNLKRVGDLQASISQKAVPDMFTGEMKPLTATERELQQDIEEFFHTARAYREGVQAKQASLLGATRKRRVTWNRRDLDSAIRAARKLVTDKPLSIFATYSGFEIKPSAPPWMDHLTVDRDGAVKGHTRDLKSGRWTVRELEKARSLGAVQREMFDPEQTEMILPTVQPKGNYHWFFLPAGKRQPRYITVAEKNRNSDFYLMAERNDEGKLYAVSNQNTIHQAEDLLESELNKAKEYTKLYPGAIGESNPYQPLYLEQSPREGFRMVMPDTQRRADARGRELGGVGRVDTMAGLMTTLQALHSLSALMN